MREAVRRLKELGPLPNESAPADALQRHEDVLRTIAEPVTDDEARLLAGLFGPDDCHGLAWTLLHLVESAPGWPLADCLEGDDEWCERLRQRVEKMRE